MGNPPGSGNGTTAAADGYPLKSDEEWSNPALSSDDHSHVGEQRSAFDNPLVAIVLALAVTEICIMIVCLVWVVVRKCKEQSEEGTTSQSSPA